MYNNNYTNSYDPIMTYVTLFMANPHGPHGYILGTGHEDKFVLSLST
jgi:hypothetical protein